MIQDGGKPTVIVVDDEATNLSFLKEILQDEFNVRLSPSGERALAFMEKSAPDLLLLDIEMPGMNGYDVIRAVKKREEWREIPILILTGQEDREGEEIAFNLGAVDYIRKPISAGVVKARVRLHMELENHRKNLEGLVETRTEQLEKMQDAILNILANMTSFRDNETGAHIKRTTIYAKVLIENLMKKRHQHYQVDPKYADSVVKSAKLHDIGKVAIPDSILFKPAKLTVEEFEVIKKHSVYGAFILDSAIDELGGDTSLFLNVAREIIIGHHEKWNGSGYPAGIKGDSIPISARIMAIADVYDALISERPYKKPFTHEVAMNIILKDAGTHFDPTLVELSLDVMESFRDIALMHKDDHSFEVYEGIYL
ncbi:MAG: response regulator [Oscillospiraceae bacterium]|jgi:putative two-component system response regulator|nr:response regulator [Oscillospiraceae bacterium]